MDKARIEALRALLPVLRREACNHGATDYKHSLANHLVSVLHTIDTLTTEVERLRAESGWVLCDGCDYYGKANRLCIHCGEVHPALDSDIQPPGPQGVKP